MFRKRKLTFYVNGKKQSLKVELICKGILIGERKWKSYNVLGKNTIISILDERGDVIEKHYFDKKGNEVIEDDAEIKSKSDEAEFERKFDESGRVVYERNVKTGAETFHEYDEKGFEIHRKLPFGYEHFFIPDSKGNVSGIRIEKDGKLVTNSIEFWSDDKRYKVRKTENFESHIIQHFIHEYTYNKSGQPIKEKFYINEMISNSI